MFIHEYGSRDCPTIILLAPMMVSGADVYSLMSPHLTGEYHIIAPDQGGHGQAGQYVSADQEGYSHCGHMAAEPGEYVRQIEAFMRRA